MLARIANWLVKVKIEVLHGAREIGVVESNNPTRERIIPVKKHSSRD